MCLSKKAGFSNLFNYLKRDCFYYTPFKLVHLFTFALACGAIYTILEFTYIPLIIPIGIIFILLVLFLLFTYKKPLKVILLYLFIVSVGICIGLYRASYEHNCIANLNPFYYGANVTITGVVNSRGQHYSFNDKDVNKVLIDMENLKSNKESASLNPIVVKGSIYACFDSAVPIKIGDRVILSGEITKLKEDFNEGAFCNLQKVYDSKITGIVYDAKVIDIKDSSQHKIARFFERLHDDIHNLMQKSLSTREACVLESILFGGANQILDKNINNAFVNLGIAHILSTSGTHVSIVLGAIIFICKFLNLKDFKTFTLAAIIGGIYIGVVGIKPPIIRAMTTGIISLYGLLSGHRYVGLQALTLVLMANILYQPYALTNISFQLSYGASYGILLFFQLLFRKIKFIPRIIRALIALSLSAQIIDLPIEIYYFHNLYLFSLLSNIIFVPIIEWIMMLGLSLLPLAMLSMFLKSFLGSFIATPFEYLLGKMWYIIGSILGFVVDILLFINNKFLTVFRIRALSFGEIVVYGIVLLGIFLYLHNFVDKKVIISVFVVSLITLIGLEVFYFKQYRVSIYSYGKVNAVLLQKGFNNVLFVQPKKKTMYNNIGTMSKVKLPYSNYNERDISRLSSFCQLKGINKANVVVLDKNGYKSNFVLKDNKVYRANKTCNKFNEYKVFREKDSKVSLHVFGKSKEFWIINGQNGQKNLQFNKDNRSILLISTPINNLDGIEEKVIVENNISTIDYFGIPEKYLILGQYKSPNFLL